jgi:UDP-N-acetylmuramoyl-L-alanyl-D-glutamate--2,6-diaminopimelate ligase
VWVVFGFGGDRDRGKRRPMGAVARQLADRSWSRRQPAVGGSGAIVDDILAGIPDRTAWWSSRSGGPRSGTRFATRVRRRGVDSPARATRPRGDRGVKRPFDDRVVARKALDEVRA